MLSWLRRTLGWFERRWIHDPEERERHDVLVRERLARREPADPGDRGTADPEPTDEG